MMVRGLRVSAVLMAGLVAAVVGGGQSAIGAPAKAPHRAATAWLNGVSATSADDVWAVGAFGHADGSAPLIEHWNGSKWQATKPFLNLEENEVFFTGVSATSGSAAVAAGSFLDQYGLLLGYHWNGRKWSQDFMPIVGPDDGTAVISGVTSVTGGQTWAVGNYYGGPDGTAQAQLTMILRWNAAKNTWVRAKSPSPAGNGNGAVRLKDGQWQVTRTPSAPSAVSEFLNSVAATSASNAWAVGGIGSRPLILHWNGARWGKPRIALPAGSTSAKFTSVTAVSANAAWAVGQASYPHKVIKLLIEHWNGKVWTLVSVPNPTP